MKNMKKVHRNIKISHILEMQLNFYPSHNIILK